VECGVLPPPWLAGAPSAARKLRRGELYLFGFITAGTSSRGQTK